ncbi:MAG: RNA polymerase sigma factor [Acidobacteriia bacterium]|nr:RNA polymerase sigma factor [Terriglobia bacterium]
MEAQADHLVMLAVRDGDVERIGVLFDRHHRMLFNFFLRLTANRALSEDLVQEVFFRMLKYRQTFQPATNYTAWMYQVARNAHLDQTRKHRLEIVPDDDAAWRDAASADLDPLEQLEQTQDIGLLRRALAKLPLEKREVLVLSRFQNLKYGEIAEILNCEIGAVKVRVYRAIRELSQIFYELSGEKAS